jgi:nitronate monooxygenase
MLKTRLTELLGIEHPIIQGGMMWVSRAELVAAVSNAGGLGILTALTHSTPEGLVEEIRATRELTERPFGVNLTLLPTLRPINYDDYFDAVVEEGVGIVETAGRSPEEYMERLKGAGITVVHKCTSVRHAVKAEKLGCDVVSIDGFECAGHPGEQDVGGLVLVPATVDAVRIPVVASGGIADGRGLVAALALGAEGVNMGTRFLATEEAPVHDGVKALVASSKEHETRLVLRTLHNSLRTLKTPVSDRVSELEARGAGIDELAPLLSGQAGRMMLETGDVEKGVLSVGQVVGLIEDVPSVSELIGRMVAEAHAVIEGLASRGAALTSS